LSGTASKVTTGEQRRPRCPSISPRYYPGDKTKSILNTGAATTPRAEIVGAAQPQDHRRPQRVNRVGLTVRATSPM
jgi:hypothetical protein